MLRQRALAVHLNPQIEQACRKSLGEFCTDKNKKGEVSFFKSQNFLCFPVRFGTSFLYYMLKIGRAGCFIVSHKFDSSLISLTILTASSSAVIFYERFIISCVIITTST